jgi:hypothetical protein
LAFPAWRNGSEQDTDGSDGAWHRGGALAAQAAGAAASQMAQQQAMKQLAGFNGQIKSKDDVTTQYQLVAGGQTAPVL